MLLTTTASRQDSLTVTHSELRVRITSKPQLLVIRSKLKIIFKCSHVPRVAQQDTIQYFEMQHANCWGSHTMHECVTISCHYTMHSTTKCYEFVVEVWKCCKTLQIDRAHDEHTAYKDLCVWSVISFGVVSVLAYCIVLYLEDVAV